MIYSVNKFWHYLLGQKFTFHVDHSALLHLVPKQSLTGKASKMDAITTRIWIWHYLSTRGTTCNSRLFKSTGFGEPDAQLFRVEVENTTEVDEDISDYKNDSIP